MITAELTDRIDDLIHLPEWHAIHLTVQFFEVRLYLLVVVRIILIETFIQKFQDRIRIPIIGWIISPPRCFSISKYSFIEQPPFPVPVSAQRRIAGRPGKLCVRMHCTGGNTDRGGTIGDGGTQEADRLSLQGAVCQRLHIL